jgi:hypothetical protein
MATTEQLRVDIDSGRTRDKVRHDDVAAAPLGTDEEAAGTPVPERAVRTARAQEVEGPAASRPMGSVWLFVLIIAMIAVALGAAAFVLAQ